MSRLELVAVPAPLLLQQALIPVAAHHGPMTGSWVEGDSMYGGRCETTPNRECVADILEWGFAEGKWLAQSGRNPEIPGVVKCTYAAPFHYRHIQARPVFS